MNILVSLMLMNLSCYTIFLMLKLLTLKINMLNYTLLFILSSYSDSLSSNMDTVELVFMSIVLTMSGFAFLYSSWYVGKSKIFSLLVLLFVCSMLLLMNFTNLWVFIWGWDFLGVVSYLLVMTYPNQMSSNAGMMTVLSNRVGDSFMMMSLSLLTLTNSWLSTIENFLSFNVMVMFIILTSITKSAQIPFCAWLPAAMAAPTPVSALVHSSTLVTAGVYLMIRYNQNNPSSVLLIMGMLTSMLAGMNACNGFDFKKLMALSTLSQLGLMFMALGLGNFKLALYHLVAHGLVKALLFLSAGLVMHQTKSNQDLRVMSGMVQGLPLTNTCICLTSLVLSGLPFMTCFFSKEVIMNQNFMKSIWLLMSIYVAASLTMNYSSRIIFSMLSSPSCWNSNNFTETSFNSFLPLLGLIPFSVMWGAFNFWSFMPVNYTNMSFDKTFTIVTWFMMMMSIFFGYMFFNNKYWGNLYMDRLTTNLLFLPVLSSNFLNSMVNLGFKTTKNLETSWSEKMGAQGLSNTLSMTELYSFEMKILSITPLFMMMMMSKLY